MGSIRDWTNCEKYGFGQSSGIWLQEYSQLKALATNSLTDLKSNNLIHANIFDTSSSNTFMKMQDIRSVNLSINDFETMI